MNIQTNIRQGVFPVKAGENLTDKEGYLVKPADSGTELEVLLPTDEADRCLYVVEEGAAADTNCQARPLVDGEMVRLVAKGTGSSGDVLALAPVAVAADKGKVETLPADADTYFSPGIAEEDFADGQHVRVRVDKQEIVVS